MQSYEDLKNELFSGISPDKPDAAPPDVVPNNEAQQASVDVESPTAVTAEIARPSSSPPANQKMLKGLLLCGAAIVATCVYFLISLNMKHEEAAVVAPTQTGDKSTEGEMKPEAMNITYPEIDYSQQKIDAPPRFTPQFGFVYNKERADTKTPVSTSD